MGGRVQLMRKDLHPVLFPSSRARLISSGVVPSQSYEYGVRTPRKSMSMSCSSGPSQRGKSSKMAAWRIGVRGARGLSSGGSTVDWQSISSVDKAEAEIAQRLMSGSIDSKTRFVSLNITMPKKIPGILCQSL
jgi:hypothetical protein